MKYAILCPVCIFDFLIFTLIIFQRQKTCDLPRELTQHPLCGSIVRV